MTDKDFSMQPTENGDKFHKFSMREIGFNLSWNFDDFQKILVQSNKAILVEAFQCAKKTPEPDRSKKELSVPIILRPKKEENYYY